MDKFENCVFKKSYKQWGKKEKCGCVEFTFDNTTWLASRANVIVTVLVTSSVLFFSFLMCQDNKLKYVLIVLVFLLSLMIVILRLLFFVRKETLYVIAPVGVQFITTYAIGKESVLFVPWHSVKNFVIVEMIVGHQIFFCLGLQNKTVSSDGLIILFQNTRPRLSSLEEIYRVIVEHSHNY